MFTGTIIARSVQQDTICYKIRPDVVAGLPGDVYGFWAPEEGITPLGARVRCSYGPAPIVSNFVTIVAYWIDPARI